MNRMRSRNRQTMVTAAVATGVLATVGAYMSDVSSPAQPAPVVATPSMAALSLPTPNDLFAALGGPAPSAFIPDLPDELNALVGPNLVDPEKLTALVDPNSFVDLEALTTFPPAAFAKLFDPEAISALFDPNSYIDPEAMQLAFPLIGLARPLARWKSAVIYCGKCYICSSTPNITDSRLRLPNGRTRQ